MIVRQAGVEDAELIHSIGCRSYRHNFSTIWTKDGIEQHLQAGFTQAKIRDSLVDQVKNIWFLLSLKPNSTPVGFTTLVFNHSIPDSNDIGLEIQKLYFEPSASGKGCGNYLMKFIVSYAQEKNYEKLWLAVLKSNTGAIRFYESCGFQQLSERPFNTDINQVGQWVMVKTL